MSYVFRISDATLDPSVTLGYEIQQAQQHYVIYVGVSSAIRPFYLAPEPKSRSGFQ
jgi:hypothetical protein